MPEINNTASTTYSFAGSGTSQTITSNTLPVNLNTTAGLSLTKSATPMTFSAGDIITYTINITNTSSSYLNGVRIIDNLGSGNLAYVLGSGRLSTSSSSYPVTPIATTPLTFTLQELASGQTMTLTYQAQVIFNLPGTVSAITNNVEGIGYTATGTINGFANETIQKKTESDFSITKSASDYDVYQNQVFDYFIVLENNTDTVANVSFINDNLPSNFNLAAVSLQIGTNPITQLSTSDYSLREGNSLTVPSATGSAITVPANSKTILTLTGSFS